MASQITNFSKTKTLIKTLSPFRPISTFSLLSQLAAEPSTATPLPPNPSTASPLYSEQWRNPFLNSNPNSIIPVGYQNSHIPFQHISQKHDLNSLLNLFADFTASQRWDEMKQLFEMWVRSLDKNGKPNRPDVNLFNHYLRANLMRGASVGYLLDLVAQMEDFAILPNTASFNMVLKAMLQGGEAAAAEKLIQRMEESGKESQPDDETFNLVVSMLLKADQVDAAMKYIDKTLKRGHMVPVKLFIDCVRICVNQGRLDMLVSVIEKCKTTDHNKALSPPWNLCYSLAEVAIQEDNSKLAFYALEFMARWIALGENTRPPVHLSVDEGLIVSALVTAGRTYSSTLLDASWAILRRSLRQRKAPNPESCIAKISAYASLGNLPKAFSALREFETAYENSEKEIQEELFSPFTSLYPLVVGCSKRGFETLDLVYLQLENLNRGDRPYKSVAALNCVILGCANIWDLDRAYQTFEAISSTFGLTPDIHSYNALMYAFGKPKKTPEASRVFEHLVSLGVKPNAMSYSLLVDAHLINRDAKAALDELDKMVSAGFEPSKEMLKKVRRRCIREMDYESDNRVDALAKRFNIRMGSENRRDMLFNLEYSITNYA